MMRYITLILGLLACSLFASPTRSGESFSVSRIHQTGVRRSGPAAIAAAFRKFGWTLPTAPHGHEDFAANIPDIYHSSKVAKRQTGKVNATPEQYHAEYLCPVTIGGQTLNMDFDTGSSDFWMFSTYLSKRTIGQHIAFNPNTSSTFQKLNGYSWQIMYGDGSGAKGVVGTDTVNIGGATVTKQAVELATALSSSFVADTLNDGLVGLGFSNINNVKPIQQKTFFDNVLPSLAQPVFTVDLKEDGTGFYQFGTIDSSKFNGELTWVAVNSSNGFWQFPSPRITIGGQQMNNLAGSPAIADTGTSLLIVDDSVAQQYYSQVPNSGYSYSIGGYIFPCAQAATLPSFGVAIGINNYMVMIPPSLINYAPVSSTWCYGGIQSNQGYALQIYGDIMFRSAFFAFQKTANYQGLGVAPKSG